MVTVALLGALGVCGSLAGCSSSPPDQSPAAATARAAEVQSTPQAAVEGWYHALGAKDTATACALMATAGAPLTGDALAQCTDGLTKIIGLATDAPADLGKLGAAKVTGAQVNGTSATVSAAQITGLPDGYAQDISLVQISGRWYLDAQLLGGS